ARGNRPPERARTYDDKRDPARATYAELRRHSPDRVVSPLWRLRAACHRPKPAGVQLLSQTFQNSGCGSLETLKLTTELRTASSRMVSGSLMNGRSWYTRVWILSLAACRCSSVVAAKKSLISPVIVVEQ